MSMRSRRNKDKDAEKSPLMLSLADSCGKVCHERLYSIPFTTHPTLPTDLTGLPIVIDTLGDFNDMQDPYTYGTYSS